MSALPTIGSSNSDIARQSPSAGRRAARRAIAEGAPRPAPSAPLTFVRMALEAAALCAFVAMVTLWADVLLGRG